MKRYWIAFATVVVLSFAVLGWTGVRVYQEAPPIPDRVVSQDGEVVIGSGLRRSKLLLTGADLLTLPGAEPLALASPVT